LKATCICSESSRAGGTHRGLHRSQQVRLLITALPCHTPPLLPVSPTPVCAFGCVGGRFMQWCGSGKKEVVTVCGGEWMSQARALTLFQRIVVYWHVWLCISTRPSHSAPTPKRTTRTTPKHTTHTDTPCMLARHAPRYRGMPLNSPSASACVVSCRPVIFSTHSVSRCFSSAAYAQLRAFCTCTHTPDETSQTCNMHGYASCAVGALFGS